MEVLDFLIPASSAATGGITVGWVAKTLLNNWLKKHDEMAAGLTAMLMQLTRIEEKVASLQRSEERTRDHDRILAVVQSHVAELKDDLNGIGRKVRGMEQS